MPSQQEKAEAFRALHEGDPFLIPNPWDAGSARILEALGFAALATTSGGFALSLGRHDGEVTLDEVAEHVRALASATRLPISVDLENGYGPEPEDAARAIAVAADAGAVGGSIEDWDRESGLYEPERAAERVAAAAEAARALGFPFTLTARAENHFRGNPDLEDTLARLRAYEEAGADVVYAPGLANAGEVRAVAEATSRPLNVIAHPGLTMREIVDAGGQRISVGSQLAWVAAGALARAAEEIRDTGEFGVFAQRLPLRDWLGARRSAVERIEPQARWDELALGEEALAALRELASQAPRGVALFAGRGRGKRAAAEVLAAEARAPLYRVDLSLVVSKYIGETEKNLRRTFDVAEREGAVLFLDEADALFGERTDVSDAHDRYADAELGYLLQRIEAHTGLAIVAGADEERLRELLRGRDAQVVRFPVPAGE